MDNEANLNLLPIIDFLFADYIEHGLYTNEIKDYEQNGEGDINWNLTIEEEDAYLANGQAIYFNLITDFERTDEQDFIRHVHMHVLTECNQYLQALSVLNIFEYPEHI
ncbi:LlaJI family restriction endonuclease [Bacillus sp. DJP31]|uniref:LlaJI family restriction endonuclease n=1 Tax=Bacillus sp. DJP31 TaxID=3409789 RepID=UPI003BB6BDD0